MVYTLGDIVTKIEAIREFTYCKVEVDGCPVGVMVVSDVLEQMRRFGDLHRKVKKIFLSGKVYPIKESISFAPVTSDYIFDGDDKYFAKMTERGLTKMSKAVNWRVAEKPSEKALQQSSIGLDGEPRRQSSNQNSVIQVKPRKQEELGMLGKLKRWLKGDKNFKR